MTEEFQIANKAKIINRKGQALLEFLLLFAVLTVISFGVLNGVGQQLAIRWTNIANKIIGPTPNPNNHSATDFIQLR